MKLRALLGVVGLVVVGLVPLTASAAPVPTCVVVDAAPVHAQVGYAPHGPSECQPLP